MMTSTLRWFWRIYIPVAILVLLGMPAISLGPAIEESLAPIRVNQRMEDIVRSPGRLCWSWVSVKVRPIVSDNMDVFLETSTDRMVLAIFERDTGLPWGRSRAVGLGPHRQNYCLLLPPNVAPAEPIRVIQRAYYPGFLGLWHTTVRFPDIVDPPP